MSLVSPRARALAAIAALVFAALVGLSWTRPPAPVPASAPPAEFSSARARAHLAEIARRPRRIGSVEHARVRGYIVDRLRAMGSAPAIQEAVVHRRHGEDRFAAVRNVVAVKKGTGRGKALLLVAHYDTRAMTPGASDDGFGVATLLETMRALSAGGPLESDVIALFTDGEEEGLLGAHAFVTSHPLARNVGMVINFEARGNAGPALMFQTSDDNGALIRAFAAAAARPTANSLSQAIYRRMPNDTDLSEWLPRTPALNIANIGGFERYHAPTDTIDDIDEGTLQHHGAYALSLARALAARTLALPPEPDATYFNAGPFFIHYPGAWSTPLAGGAASLLAIFVVFGALRGTVRPGRVLLALVARALAVAAGSGLAIVLWLVAKHSDHAILNAARPAYKGLYFASFIAAALAVVITTEWILSTRTRAFERLGGAAALFTALAVLAALKLPGAAFLFTWPAIFALLVGIVLVLVGAEDSRSRIAVVLHIAAPLPAFALVGPFIPQLHAAFGPDGAAAPVALVALLAALAAPALRYVVGSTVVAPLAALAVAAALHAGARLLPPFDRDHPHPNHLLFAVDADAGRAFWLSVDPVPDRWTSNALAHPFVRQEVPLPFSFAERGILASDAAAVNEPGPEITWLADTRTDAGRSIRLRVVPPPGAELLAVRVDGAVMSAFAAGQSLSTANGLAFRYYAPPAGGVELVLTTATAKPITVRAVSQRAGFPEKASSLPGPRPPGMMARPGMMPPWDDLLESDMTIVARTATR